MRGSLEIADNTVARGLPAAHVGANAGRMLYGEGDYFARTVNIAARISSQASAGQVYVGEALAGSVVADGFRLLEVGEFALKGVAAPVRIFEATRWTRE